MARRDAGSLDRDLLADATEILASTLDPERVLRRCAELLVPEFADTVAVFVPDGEGGARLAHHAHADAATYEEVESVYGRASLVGDSPVLRVLESGEPELFGTVDDDLVRRGACTPRQLEGMRARGTRSLIFVPLAGREHVLGVLILTSSRPERAYTASDQSLAGKLARLAALAAENARLYESERGARQSAERMQRLTAALAQVVSPEDAAVTMAHAARAAFDASMVSVSLVGDDGALELVAQEGYAEAPDLCRRVSLVESSPVGDAVANGESVFVSRPEELAARYPERRITDEMGQLAWAFVPITSSGGPLGVVSLGFPPPRTFPAHERETLLAMAQQCASTIERVFLFRAEQRAREALAETNQTLQALIEASPAAIVVLDAQSHVHMWNPSAEQLFGWGRGEVVGRRLNALFGESELDALVARVLRGEPARGIETRQMRRDGEPIDVALWAAPLSRGDDTPLCLVVLIDVTDRKRAEAAAREASRRKDEFFAMLGHELRNPLAPILTALELMKTEDGQAVEEARRVIERQAKHLVRLVDDLLDLSRVTRGKIELSLEDVEAWDVFSRAIEMTSPLLEEQSHALEVDVPRTGLRMHGDPLRLAQVLQNLLSNSAKYTPREGRITVRARREGAWVELRIEDDGAGIGPDLLPTLFDPFVQGERTIDRAQGGLGLGLALVHSLVSLHRGTVRAESDGVGRGTAMTVRIPAAEEHPAVRPTVSKRPDDRPTPTPGRRVLVVDDNLDAAEMLAILLRRRGHVVELAHDGPSALEVFERFEPDAALLDIGLPVMDGYELAQRIRRRAEDRDVLLVAVTGYGQETDREKSRAAGFAHHLVKPVSTKALLSILAAEPLV